MGFAQKCSLLAKKKATVILALWILFAVNALPILPARAAVPVLIVENQAGTEFERSTEEFLFNLSVAEKKFDFELLMNLREREEDFTASFELQKIEKAREDVNKLVLETLKELENKGQLLDRSDFALGSSNSAPKASALKGSRIIRNPYEYLYAEPLAAGRLAMICYYNFIIWDQQGDLFGDEDKATYATESNGDNLVQGPEAVNSVENVRKLRGRSLLEAAWNLANSQELADPGLEGIFLNDNDPNVPGYCFQIYETFGLVTPDFFTTMAGYYDPLLGLDAEEVDDIRRSILGLSTLKLRVIGRNDVTWEEISESKKPQNTLTGLKGVAEGVGTRVANAVGKVHELNYTIGQGVRPESLYLEFSGPPQDLDGDGDLESVKYPFDTGYVVSPAAILLQKMQSATQSQFDLAQQGFMYLNPWAGASAFNDENVDFLAKYNLGRSTPPALVSVADPNRRIPWGTSDNASSLRLFLPTVSTGKFVIKEDDTEEEKARKLFDIPPEPIGIMNPWLRPTPTFRSATNPVEMEVGGVPGFRLPVTGLPAPWEDESDYLAIGSYGDTRYRIDNYRPNRGEGDNIGVSPSGKWLGMDYGINDWFDRVLEMYEPSPSGDQKYGFSISDWRCLLETWLQRVDLKTREPDGGDDDAFTTNCQHRLDDGSY